MLGQSSLGIGVTMFLRDQFSGPANRVKASALGMTEEFRKMQEEQLRHQRNMYAGLAMAGAMAVRQIGKAVKQGAEFGYEMEYVSAITSATKDEAKDLGSLAKQLGEDTMFFSQDVAEGMRFMGMAGMTAQQIKQNIGSAVALAGSTKWQIGGKGGTADIMTNIMKAFQIEAKYSGDVADMLSYATTRANTNIFDLGEALKYAGSTAMDMSVSLQEATAMTMALGNAGMQGSMAGVAMENAMRYMARATGAFGSGTQQKALDMIGLTKDDITDSTGNLLSMVDVIKEVGSALEANFGEGQNIEKQGVLQTIFGVRGKRAGSLLIRNLKEFDSFVSDVSTKSAGHSDRVLKDMMESLKGYFLRVQSAAKNMAIALSDTLEPTLKSMAFIIEKTIKAMKWLLESGFGKFLGPAIAGWVTIKTVMWGVKAIVKGLTLVKMQMGSTWATVSSANVVGWNRQTAAATRYTAATKMAAAASIAGMARPGALRVNAAGGVYRTRTRGSRKAGQMVSAGVAARYASMYGAKKVAGQAVTRGALGLTSRAALPMLGRLVGIFTGPLGMVLTFVLPGLIGMAIGAIKKNKDATQRATDAQEKNTELLKSHRVGAIEFLNQNKQRILAARDFAGFGQIGAGQVTQEGFDKYIRSRGISYQKGMEDYMEVQPVVNVYIDGEEITERTVEKVSGVLRRQYHNTGMR